MHPVPYNRALAGQRYFLGVFTHTSLAVMLGGILFLMAVANFYCILVFAAAFTTYQAYLRFGKPPGYDQHLLRALITPRALRPGRGSFVRPIKDSR